jgi:UDP-glucose 4-epimerase
VSWLVTGGAGYIGAHVVRVMIADGIEVVVLDDLSTGDATRVRGVPLIIGTIRDRRLVRDVLRKHAVHGVMHIAVKKQVSESVTNPLLYYRENVEGLIAVLDACQSEGVQHFVFSSSAATYGMPDVDLVTENTVRTAVALRREQTHRRVVGPRLHHLGIVGYLPVLFQRRGSGHSRTRRSWRLQPHPAGLSALSRGERPVVFGDDYPTPDGTCIRDYVHVADIADAHVVAACALQAGGPSATCNVGRGEGSSVLDVLRVRRGHRDHHRTRCTDQAFR